MERETARPMLAKDVTPVVDLWPDVAQVLGITAKQASDFVEQQISDLELVLYEYSAQSGLYHSIGRADESADLAHGRLIDLWNLAEGELWAAEAMKQFRSLCVTSQAGRAILASASQFASQGPEQHGLNLEQRFAGEVDPADLPEELHAANLAHRAVINGYGDRQSTFKNRLIEYLKQNFSSLTDEAVQRIAIVANPDKAPGRRRRT